MFRPWLKIAVPLAVGLLVLAATRCAREVDVPAPKPVAPNKYGNAAAFASSNPGGIYGIGKDAFIDASKDSSSTSDTQSSEIGEAVQQCSLTTAEIQYLANSPTICSCIENNEYYQAYGNLVMAILDCICEDYVCGTKVDPNIDPNQLKQDWYANCLQNGYCIAE